MIYHKFYSTPDAKVIKANINGGNLFGTHITSLDYGKKRLLGQLFTPGDYRWTIQRSSSDTSLSVDFQTQINMSCDPKPVISKLSDVIVTYQIQPVGKTVTPINATIWNLSADHGCGDDTSHDTAHFCTSQDTAIITGNITHALGSSNCPAGASDIDSVRQSSPGCVDVKYHMHGCGFDWLRSCKGGGSIGAVIAADTSVEGPSQGGAILKGQQPPLYDGLTQTLIPYILNVPPDFKLDDWIWQVTISTFEDTPSGHPKAVVTDISSSQRCSPIGTNLSDTVVGRMIANSLVVERHKTPCSPTDVTGVSDLFSYYSAHKESAVLGEMFNPGAILAGVKDDGLARVSAGTLSPGHDVKAWIRFKGLKSDSHLQ